jgi:arylsulfatase
MMVRGDGHDQTAPPGSAATFLSIGPGWSSLANTPFRRHKTWVHEGGISTPLIVHWPAGISTRGGIRHTPAHLIDIVPTLLDLTGTERLTNWNGTPIPPAPGKSLLSAFANDANIPRENLWWFHEGNKALLQQPWKLVASKNKPWELYNLNTDRAESRDLASQSPQRVSKMEAIWNQRLAEFKALATKDLPDAPQAGK